MNFDEAKDFIQRLKTNPSLSHLTSKDVPALNSLIEQCDEVLVLIDQQKKQMSIDDKIDALESSVNLLQKTINENTLQLQSLTTELKNQQNELFVTNKNYSQMVEKIQMVLTSLEDYLRRHA